MRKEFDFLLYGANGYTGRLIARWAAAKGMRPLLAGRNADAVCETAAATGFEHEAFPLEDGDRLLDALRKCRFALHAAGPFRHTLDAMIRACLESGRHYVDINGDIACFERIRAYDDEARERGVMLLPGAGFDVIPTDCLARLLHERMPEAVSLRIAFASLGSRLSHGTATTMTTKPNTTYTFDHINDATGFANGATFESEASVREYFTAAAQIEMFGDDAETDPDTLSAYADDVINNRWHMA